jgi:hypothetical protein
MPQNSGPFSGGCQCGAVRYRGETLGGSAICHCRMCQKAFGSIFGALVTAPGLVWTRGEPKYFHSSNRARRGFCAECGTPLCYVETGAEVEIAVGTLDDPSVAPPTKQINIASKVPFFDHLHELIPQPNPEREAAFNATVTSYQHPDHDTESWPPQPRSPEEGFAA